MAKRKGHKPEQPWMKRRAMKRAVRNCAAKVVYKTVDEADAAAQKYSQQVYPCRICGEFHLTSIKKED